MATHRFRAAPHADRSIAQQLILALAGLALAACTQASDAANPFAPPSTAHGPSFVATAAAPAGYIVDQAYEGPFQSTHRLDAYGSGNAQGFTPTVSRLDAVDLFVTNTGAGDQPAGLTITVNIRQNSIDGLILGTTTVAVPTALAGTAQAPTELTAVFSSPITLAPGALYFIQAVQSGGGSVGLAFSENAPYAGGIGYQQGWTGIAMDFGFRTYVQTVVAVPAPTTADQCRNGGWAQFTQPHPFKNQGDCVSYVGNGK